MQARSAISKAMRTLAVDRTWILSAVRFGHSGLVVGILQKSPTTLTSLQEYP